MRKLALALALLGAALPAHAQDPVETVTVQLSNFDFTPDHIELQHGHRYVLHLVSIVGGGHDFTAPQFFAAANVAPADRAKIDHGRVAVHGRATVNVQLTAPAAGTYPLHCSHFGHAAFGMTGQIVVR
jgi:uncharacterized cupredoxin-like copper-binding protein